MGGEAFLLPFSPWGRGAFSPGGGLLLLFSPCGDLFGSYGWLSLGLPPTYENFCQRPFLCVYHNYATIMLLGMTWTVCGSYQWRRQDIYDSSSMTLTLRRRVKVSVFMIMWTCTKVMSSWKGKYDLYPYCIDPGGGGGGWGVVSISILNVNVIFNTIIHKSVRVSLILSNNIINLNTMDLIYSHYAFY